MLSSFSSYRAKAVLKKKTPRPDRTGSRSQGACYIHRLCLSYLHGFGFAEMFMSEDEIDKIAFKIMTRQLRRLMNVLSNIVAFGVDPTNIEPGPLRVICRNCNRKTYYNLVSEGKCLECW